MKILVVDDSSVMRRIIKKTLERLESQKAYSFSNISEAEDGVEAWNTIINTPGNFDLILTDWNMPNMNGLDLIKKIRAKRQYDDIPIIMVTTEGGKTEVIAALKAGVNNYIVKPFTPQILYDKIRETI